MKLRFYPVPGWPTQRSRRTLPSGLPAANPQPQRRRVAVSVMLLLASIVLIPLGAAVPASASSDVCSAAADVDIACLHVIGTGGGVQWVQMSGNLVPPDPRTALGICDYSARVRISAYGNPNYIVRTGASGPGGCSYGTAWINVYINGTFPIDHSWVCGQFFIKGAPEGREMCIKLTRGLLG